MPNKNDLLYYYTLGNEPSPVTKVSQMRPKQFIHRMFCVITANTTCTVSLLSPPLAHYGTIVLLLQQPCRQQPSYYHVIIQAWNE